MASFEFLAIILTGLGLIVSILYYTFTLQNSNKTQRMQLENRQVQLFWNIYKEQQQPDYEARMHYVINLEYNDFEDFQKKYGRDNNPEGWSKISSFLTFLQGLGVLVREEYVDVKLVVMLMSSDILTSWRVVEPWILESRIRYNRPSFGIEMEYLYNSIIEYAEKHPERQIKLPEHNR
jgi:hypothetical protein